MGVSSLNANIDGGAGHPLQGHHQPLPGGHDDLGEVGGSTTSQLHHQSIDLGAHPLTRNPSANFFSLRIDTEAEATSLMVDMKNTLPMVKVTVMLDAKDVKLEDELKKAHEDMRTAALLQQEHQQLVDRNKDSSPPTVRCRSKLTTLALRCPS